MALPQVGRHPAAGLDYAQVVRGPTRLRSIRCSAHHACIARPRPSRCPPRAAHPTLNPWPRPEGARVTAWTDGAGAEAGSCGLARVAWAFHMGRDGRSQAGPVPGAQSVQRAELYAVVMAAVVAPGGLLVVTDSQYVANGSERSRGRLRPPEGKHADLWAYLLRYQSRLGHTGSSRTFRRLMRLQSEDTASGTGKEIGGRTYSPEQGYMDSRLMMRY